MTMFDGHCCGVRTAGRQAGCERVGTLGLLVIFGMGCNLPRDGRWAFESPAYAESPGSPPGRTEETSPFPPPFDMVVWSHNAASLADLPFTVVQNVGLQVSPASLAHGFALVDEQSGAALLLAFSEDDCLVAAELRRDDFSGYADYRFGPLTLDEAVFRTPVSYPGFGCIVEVDPLRSVHVSSLICSGKAHPGAHQILSLHWLTGH